MPSVHPPQDASLSAAPRDISRLPFRSLGSAQQWSDSADLATSADPPVVGWPRELTETTPVALVPAPPTASSCNVALRSELPPATGSSAGCAPAPCGAGATAVAAHPGSPSSAPRSAETDSPPATAEYVVH